MHPKPKPRGNYSEENLLMAIAEIQDGVSYKNASIKYGVPIYNAL